VAKNLDNIVEPAITDGMKPLLRLSEAAALLRISTCWARQLCHAGKMPHRRMGAKGWIYIPGEWVRSQIAVEVKDSKEE